jgi:hypothetical protein
MTATKPEGGYLRAFYADTIMIRSITSSWMKFVFPVQMNDERIRWALCGNVVLREGAMAWALGATMRLLQGTPCVLESTPITSS